MALTALTEILFPTTTKLRMPMPTVKQVELFCNVSLEGLLPSLAFSLILIVLCATLGFLTRKLPENFNESWYIFVSVATTMFLWLVFLPTYFTSFYAYNRVILLTSCVIINAAITLVCLFISKIRAVYFPDEGRHLAPATFGRAGLTAPSRPTAGPSGGQRVHPTSSDLGMTSGLYLADSQMSVVGV